MSLDLVLRQCRIAGREESPAADIGIKDGRIVAIEGQLPGFGHQ